MAAIAIYLKIIGGETGFDGVKEASNGTSCFTGRHVKRLVKKITGEYNYALAA